MLPIVSGNLLRVSKQITLSNCYINNNKNDAREMLWGIFLHACYAV